MSEPRSWWDPRTAAVRAATYEPTGLEAALARLSDRLGWGASGRGPFGGMITPGARVLVKPNWVLHRNQGPWGMEPLVTHPAVVRTVTEAALRAGPAEVVVGDAPVQGCDFETLLAAGGLREWEAALRAADPRFAGIRDFRRTKVTDRDGHREAREDLVPLDRFVLFDLAGESLLEPITGDEAEFRVTQYDPAKMARTHHRGRHQYLVAREVIAADVIVNLPKLKTHKKAGVTCALKNLIGINGNKEFLPHHRVGGAEAGGDCYPGRSIAKRALEHALDHVNAAPGEGTRRAWGLGARVLQRVVHMSGDELGVEGSWSGNDTIWRTCLDLNRILLYGREDGTLADRPQRIVLNVVDAVTAGQGDGPLAPQPLPLSLLIGGTSSAAVDWVGASLLAYDPRSIPIAREAFGRFRWPLTTAAAEDVCVVDDDGVTRSPTEFADRMRADTEVIYPVGWRDAVRPGRGASIEATPVSAPGDA